MSTLKKQPYLENEGTGNVALTLSQFTKVMNSEHTHLQVRRKKASSFETPNFQWMRESIKMFVDKSDGETYFLMPYSRFSKLAAWTNEGTLEDQAQRPTMAMPV